MNDEYDLGEQFYLWEIATAAAGSVLGIDAFDQPNVQESKDNTKALLAQYEATGSIPEPTPDVEGTAFDITYLSGSKSVAGARDVTKGLSAVFKQLAPGDYVAICAYIARDPAHIVTLD
jgi:transaldolase / glucose-6-phosphate isomerase